VRDLSLKKNTSRNIPLLLLICTLILALFASITYSQNATETKPTSKLVVYALISLNATLEDIPTTFNLLYNITCKEAMLNMYIFSSPDNNIYLVLVEVRAPSIERYTIDLLFSCIKSTNKLPPGIRDKLIDVVNLELYGKLYYVESVKLSAARTPLKDTLTVTTPTPMPAPTITPTPTTTATSPTEESLRNYTQPKVATTIATVTPEAEGEATRSVIGSEYSFLGKPLIKAALILLVASLASLSVVIIWKRI